MQPQLMRVTLFTLILLTHSIFAQPPVKPIASARNEVDEKDLACAACLAIVDIVDQHMVKKSFDGVETKLYDVLESVCEQKHYRTYDFIPPKMVEACKKFVDKNEDDVLVEAFKQFYSSSGSNGNPQTKHLIERKICLNVSGECIGNKRLEDKKSKEKLGSKTPEQDKHFDATVDDIMAKHGHKMKSPSPVKHTDEL